MTHLIGMGDPRGPNTGLLIGGAYVPIDGLHIMSPHPSAPAWVGLSSRDYHLRPTRWVRQIMLHTTKGKWPQHVKPGKGSGGRDKVVADFWRGDPEHSAAQIVIDNDGTIVCLCDLMTIAAYHATTTNDWSIGIELYQEADGGIHAAVFDALVRLVRALCRIFRIPYQIAMRRYNGTIIPRMIHGGPDMVGIFGHHDCAWDFEKNTSTRGRGDPGDIAKLRLVDDGAEAFDFGSYGEIAAWKQRQRWLNMNRGERLVIDGIAGPGTMSALERHGFEHGRDIPLAA